MNEDKILTLINLTVSTAINAVDAYERAKMSSQPLSQAQKAELKERLIAEAMRDANFWKSFTFGFLDD